jgi:hypothetical protein
VLAGLVERATFHNAENGFCVKARFLRTSPPTSAVGIEKYRSSGMIRRVGPVYAKKLLRAVRRSSMSQKPRPRQPWPRRPPGGRNRSALPLQTAKSARHHKLMHCENSFELMGGDEE